MSRAGRALLWCLTLLAVLSALPPLGNLLMRMMFTQMLVQIPLIFAIAAMWAGRMRCSAGARWRAWNVQGASGLLIAALVSAYWMTPIALDHAAANSSWEAAKVICVAIAGLLAGASWALGSLITRAFYVGNTLWMAVTVGMLYRESTERFCNAYLWNDQVMTGRALVIASICIASIWAVRTAGLSWRAVTGRPDMPL
jgi:hypothetical protein